MINIYYDLPPDGGQGADNTGPTCVQRGELEANAALFLVQLFHQEEVVYMTIFDELVPRGEKN